jgi:vacuolar protein sorting-associated protein 54
VRRKDFNSYIKAVTPDWEQFERNIEREHDAPAEAESSLMTRFLQSSEEHSFTPRASRFPSGPAIPPLESIPAVYFEKDFDLGDSQTFALVTEQIEGDGDSIDPASLSHSLPLLEKLSHYADTIELHLIREISLRSSSFFAALTNLNDLQSESTRCLTRIRELRTMLNDVDTQSARRGMEVVWLECKMQNMAAVKEGMRAMQDVGDMFGAARSLANAGEWGEALGVVEEIGRLWEVGTTAVTEKQQQAVKTRPGKGRSRPVSSYGQPSNLSSVSEAPSEPSKEKPALSLPLKSLSAFASLPDHLKALTLDISTSLTTELITLLKTDLLVRLDQTSHTAGSPPKQVDRESDARTSLRDQLTPLLLGIRRTNGLSGSVSKWREVALAEIRASVKRVCALQHYGKKREY